MHKTTDFQRMERLRINRLIERWQLDFQNKVSLSGGQKEKGIAGKGKMMTEVY